MDNSLLLLKQLHEVSNGNVDHEANFHKMAVDLNLGCMERDNAFRSLLNKKYILNSGMGYGCYITPQGIEAVMNTAAMAPRRSSIIPRIRLRPFGDYFKTISLTKELGYNQGVGI